jgi:hypothetical protein
VRLPGHPAEVCLQTADRRWALTVDSAWKVLKTWGLSHDVLAPGPDLGIPAIPRLGSMIALSPDGMQLAYIAGPNVVDIWDIATNRLLERWTAPGASQLQNLVWREKLTAIDSLSGAMRLWREP